MTGQELAERCFEIPARVERIVHLAVLGEMEDEVLEWMTEDAAGALREALGFDLSAIPGMDDSNVEERREALSLALAHKSVFGWLVEVSTPVKHPTGGGSWRFSWGNFESQVFYADSYEAAVDAGLSWAASTLDLAVGA